MRGPRAADNPAGSVSAFLTSQRREERDQVVLLLTDERDAEARLVVIDDGRDAGGGSIVEVRRARRQAAQRGDLELVHVGPPGRDQRPPRIGGPQALAGERASWGVHALKRVERNIGGAAR